MKAVSRAARVGGSIGPTYNVTDRILSCLSRVLFPFGRINHLLIDLDGVLYRGTMTLGHAPEFIHWLHAHHIQYRLVTNNATLTPRQYVAKLAKMQIVVKEHEVFTSALATALHLRRENASGQRALVVGEEGLLEALRSVNVEPAEERVDWVVVGLDRHATYDKLARAALALQNGARFVGTNPDLSFPSENGLLPGAGALQSVLTATTGVPPTVIGKPQPLMFRLALESLGSTANNTAMLGDRLDTDIQGAANAGIPSILVLTGISTRSDLEQSSIHPDVVVNDLKELMERWRDGL